MHAAGGGQVVEAGHVLGRPLRRIGEDDVVLGRREIGLGGRHGVNVAGGVRVWRMLAGRVARFRAGNVWRMDLIWDGIREAARLWWSGDGEIIEITLRTLAISAAATALALAIGIPLGAVLALRRFWGRGLIVAAVNTGMGMPPVVIGLLVALILWRTGPLGELNLIYTPTAMVVAQLPAQLAAGGGLLAGLDSSRSILD